MNPVRHSRRVDFGRVNATALRILPVILGRLIPDGRIIGAEYSARNPTRSDRHPGSFKINIRTGRWSDFATGDRGGDPVSLAAYLENVPQPQAARLLGRILGIDAEQA